VSALGPIATVKSDSEKLQTAAAFGPILKAKRRCERSEHATFRLHNPSALARVVDPRPPTERESRN
jgi:hypothetical protein